MVATAVITTISLCNQGKYLIQGKEGWKEPVNLYSLIVARPSERKTPTMVKVVKLKINQRSSEKLLLF